jgi:hypothetical protein
MTVSMRFCLAAVIYGPATVLPLGCGITAILAIPLLAPHAGTLLLHVAAESLVIGAALAWHTAPILQSARERRNDS